MPHPPVTASISFLGGLRIEYNGAVLTDEINRSLKLWNVLSYIMIHRNRAVPQSEFIELFWPDDNSSNPINALKTLLYRIRALLESVFGTELQPVISQRGSYSWNPNISCTTDIDLFESLCRKAADPALSGQDRRDLCRRAIALYRGPFLPKLGDELWVVPLATRYHTLYLQMVKSLAALLEEDGHYDEMISVCSRACTMGLLDSLDEELHILIIRAMLAQNKTALALDHYARASDLLYRNLGVRPSKKLSDLYASIMGSEQTLQTDLDIIKDDLKEAVSRSGAFICEYGFFREIYRLEARRCLRNGSCIHVGLFTVSLPNGGIPPLKVLNTTMDQLLEVIVAQLRKGDVVARYSSSQYVLMLPNANFEDSETVLSRISATFYRQHRRNYLQLSYKIRELDINSL